MGAVVVLVLAVGVGLLFGAVAEEPGPDAEFRLDQSGGGESLVVTAEHVDGEPVDASDLALTVDGVGSLNGSTSLADWGVVRENATARVGFVADADLEDGDVNGTVEEGGQDVVALAFGDRPLTEGTVLVAREDGDVRPNDLRTVTLSWEGTWSEQVLDDLMIDR